MRIYRHFLAVFFFLFTFHSFAQDIVTLTWKGGVNKQFTIFVEHDKEVTVCWGDGSVTDAREGTMHTYTDTQNYTVNIICNSANCIEMFSCSTQEILSLDVSKCTTLYYLLCNNNQIRCLDLSNNNTGQYYLHLECQNNQLSSLVINKNTTLYPLYCYNNQLLLSDLDVLGSRVTGTANKRLGSQKLPTRQLVVGDTIDFSSQARFGYNHNTPTDFVVTKNGTSAIPNVDYTIDSGKIVFLVADTYMLTMTNSAITSHQDFPAKLIVEFIVNEREPNTDASLASLTVSEGVLEPNFHSDTLNYFVEIEYSITNIDITATANDSLATVVGTGRTPSLQIGDNIFTITVTAEDTTITQNYIITVHRKDTVIDTTNIVDLRVTGNELWVYPNPTTGQLIINNEQLTIKNVEIFDIVGCKLSAFCFLPSAFIEIDISHLASGIYFLRIDGKTMKLVKE